MKSGVMGLIDTVMPGACEAPACRADLDIRALSLGLRLCAACRDRLARQLSRLPALYKECEETLLHRADHSAGRVSGRWPGGICLNEGAVTVRSNMTDVLASWCEMVVGERGVPRPGRRTVGQLAAFLRTHLEWLSAHPAAADFAAEVAKLVAAASDVTCPDPILTMDLGPCAEPGCQRILRATIRGPDQSLTQQVRCDAGHIWLPHQWLLLGRRIERARHRLTDGAPDQAEEMAV
jgi:hypothetical protein